MSKDQKQTCLYCAAYSRGSDEMDYGQCRKRAPSIEGWPPVGVLDWCLEFNERRDDWESVGDAANQALANLRKRMDERK